MVVAPICRAVLNLAILLRVVIHVWGYERMPAAYALHRCLVVEEFVALVAELVECLDIYRAVVLKGEELANQRAARRIAPLQWRLATRVALHATRERRAEGVVVVVGEEEELVVVAVGAIDMPTTTFAA